MITRLLVPLALAAAFCVPLAATADAAPQPSSAPVAGEGGTRQLRPGQETFSTKEIAPRSAVQAQFRKGTYYYGPITIEPNTWHETWVFCPAGMRATGGGESNTSANVVTLRGTFALDGGAGWKVNVANLTGTTSTFKVWTVCYSDLGNYLHITDKRGVDPGRDVLPQPKCPPGLGLYGGGGSSDIERAKVFTSQSLGFVGDIRWWFGVANLDGIARTVNGQAVCGTGMRNQARASSGRVSVAPGQIASGAAYCPTGTWVVSGGANQVTGSSLMRITDSYPEGEGWRVVYANEGPDEAGAFVAVDCGN
ncbi:hypothetical protein [Amycolatopsis sp. NPDC049868]|uniref:hypothetical protein n=1 Tax=Amycolatopsis sp. NPDC049868 TaxID=3363934 RepID=UPI0037A7E31C